MRKPFPNQASHNWCSKLLVVGCAKQPSHFAEEFVEQDTHSSAIRVNQMCSIGLVKRISHFSADTYKSTCGKSSNQTRCIPSRIVPGVTIHSHILKHTTWMRGWGHLGCLQLFTSDLAIEVGHCLLELLPATVDEHCGQIVNNTHSVISYNCLAGNPALLL